MVFPLQEASKSLIADSEMPEFLSFDLIHARRLTVGSCLLRESERSDLMGSVSPVFEARAEEDPSAGPAEGGTKDENPKPDTLVSLSRDRPERASDIGTLSTKADERTPEPVVPNLERTHLLLRLEDPVSN